MENFENFTILSLGQVLGDNRLEIFKKYSTKCEITDFALLLGGSFFSKNFTISEKNYYMSAWWTKSHYRNGSSVHIINSFGDSTWANIDKRGIGVRPVVSYSSISNNCFNKRKIDENILLIEYGEYPQSIVPSNIAHQLEYNFRKENLEISNKKYTTDKLDHYQTSKFEAEKHIEYCYNNKKYIRFYNGLNCDQKLLTNGNPIRFERAYWIEVKPITWIVDESMDLAISRRILLPLQFSNKNNYKDDFEKTHISMFLNKCLSKEIVTTKISTLEETEKVKKLSKF